MYKLFDANYLYVAGCKAMKSSRFKYGTQYFRMHHLLETAHLQRELMAGTYEPREGRKFLIKERGHERYITSDLMRDKAVNHLLSDEYVMPAIRPYLDYDNAASQKHRGVSHYRKRLEQQIREFHKVYGPGGWAMFIDFSGFYPNLHHAVCKDSLMKFVRMRNVFAEAEEVRKVLDKIFKKFEKDVSRFKDSEIARMYREKISPTFNAGVSKALMTGKKMLKKGVDIGNQISQDVGILIPYVIDNFIRIVKGCKFFGRYTDDTHVFHPSRAFLVELLHGIEKIAEKIGIIINKKKTRIVRIDDFFRHLQMGYRFDRSGSFHRMINPKRLAAEKRRLKAYKRLRDKGILTDEAIDDAFRSWLGSFFHYLTHGQITDLSRLYYKLFRRIPEWKKRHSKLHWLMVHPSPVSG